MRYHRRMTLKLTYFDGKGGRAQPARLALEHAGIDFEDVRLSFPEFAQRRGELPFGQVPILEVDGELFSQCNAINRYVGKLAKLYPEDAIQAAFCDEAMDAVEEITVKFQPSLFLKDEEQKKAVRAELLEGPIRFIVERLEALLERRGGEFFADGRLTIADLKVFEVVYTFKRGHIDYVPTDFVDQVAPKLAAHRDRVLALPSVKAQYAR